MPEFLERQLEFLQSDRGRALVWSDGWIRGDTELAGRRYLDTTGCADPPSFRTLLQQTCTVMTSSVVARRDAIEAVGRFDARIRRGQDWDLWLRLAHKGHVMVLNACPLVWRSVRPSNLSGNRASELQRAIAVLKAIPRKLPLDTEELGIVHARLIRLETQLDLELAKAALRRGDFAAARRHFDGMRGTGTWKSRCASWAVRIAPGLLRDAYMRSATSVSPTEFVARP